MGISDFSYFPLSSLIFTFCILFYLSRVENKFGKNLGEDHGFFLIKNGTYFLFYAEPCILVHEWILLKYISTIFLFPHPSVCNITFLA